MISSTREMCSSIQLEYMITYSIYMKLTLQLNLDSLKHKDHWSVAGALVNTTTGIWCICMSTAKKWTGYFLCTMVWWEDENNRNKHLRWRKSSYVWHNRWINPNWEWALKARWIHHSVSDNQYEIGLIIFYSGRKKRRKSKIIGLILLKPA